VKVGADEEAGAGEAPLRLSPVHYAAQRLGAEFTNRAGWRVAWSYTSIEEEAAAAKERAGLADVSALGKLLVRGAGAQELLAERREGRPAAQADTGWAALSDDSGSFPPGGYLVRLAPDELFAVCRPGAEGELAARVEEAQRLARRFVTVVDQTSGLAGLLLSGPGSRVVLSKLCALSFHPGTFPDHHAVQSGCAAIRATIVRNDLGGVPAFEVYFERPYAEYVWGCATDAGQECGLAPTGWGALELLARNGNR
jgi:aminomethyltransferase